MFDFVRLPNSIELNPRIEFDCVRLGSIFERSIYYAGLDVNTFPRPSDYTVATYYIKACLSVDRSNLCYQQKKGLGINFAHFLLHHMFLGTVNPAAQRGHVVALVHCASCWEGEGSVVLSGCTISITDTKRFIVIHYTSKH